MESADDGPEESADDGAEKSAGPWFVVGYGGSTTEASAGPVGMYA